MFFFENFLNIQQNKTRQEMDKFSLKWNDFQDVLKSSVGELRDDADFTDVTLACEDQSLKAHKVTLSATVSTTQARAFAK